MHTLKDLFQNKYTGVLLILDEKQSMKTDIIRYYLFLNSISLYVCLEYIF